MFGRDEIVRLLWDECLDRRPEWAALPIVAVLGPRGSGKTTLLDHLAEHARLQDAQPSVPVLDLETEIMTAGWHVPAWLAFQLTACSWPRFGRLRFPRFTLGRIVLRGGVRT